MSSYRNADARTRPRTIVACDYDKAWLTSFVQLRAEEIAELPRVTRDALEEAPRGTFIVPFVASLEGGVSDHYVIEAEFESDAPITMTLMPFGITRTVPARSSFRDLVYEVFRRTDAGWLRVHCDRPLRAAVSLVNLGRREAVRIPLVTSARESQSTSSVS